MILIGLILSAAAEPAAKPPARLAGLVEEYLAVKTPTRSAAEHASAARAYRALLGTPARRRPRCARPRRPGGP